MHSEWLKQVGAQSAFDVGGVSLGRPAPAALHGEPVGMHDQTKEDMRTHPVLAITGQSNDTLERKQCVTIDVIAVIVHKHSQVM